MLQFAGIEDALTSSHGSTKTLVSDQSGLIASLKVHGCTLADHTFLFLGAEEAGTGLLQAYRASVSGGDYLFKSSQDFEQGLATQLIFHICLTYC